MRKYDEKNLVIAFFRVARDPEMIVFPFPLPDYAKESVNVEEFGGLKSLKRPSGPEIPGWVYVAQHKLSMVEVVVAIGDSRDPSIGSSPGIVGVFDRTDDGHLMKMIAGCLAAKDYFEKNVMNR